MYKIDVNIVLQGEYRHDLVDAWKIALDKHKVPRTESPTLISTLSDPVKIRSWQICGLPRDNHSIENGVIVQFSQRWPLFIDPQGQVREKNIYIFDMLFLVQHTLHFNGVLRRKYSNSRNSFQANKWVKNMERDNGLDVIKLTDRDFLRSLENAVRFGKPMLLENVMQELDPALEPILLKQVIGNKDECCLFSYD